MSHRTITAGKEGEDGLTPLEIRQRADSDGEESRPELIDIPSRKENGQ